MIPLLKKLLNAMRISLTIDLPLILGFLIQDSGICPYFSKSK